MDPNGDRRRRFEFFCVLLVPTHQARVLGGQYLEGPILPPLFNSRLPPEHPGNIHLSNSPMTQLLNEAFSLPLSDPGRRTLSLSSIPYN